MSLREIKDRLFQRGTSRTSSSKGSAQKSPHSKLAKPVIHESIYVYASDNTNGGLALAEKWRLTLVQPTSSSRSKQKSTPRKSIITGVDAFCLDENLDPSKFQNDDKGGVEEGKMSDEGLPCTVIMENDYF